MKFFIPLLLFMFMFNSCEQSKEFIIKLDFRAATSNVYWQKCGTKIVFNGNVVGTYCNDDVDDSIFKFTDSTFNRKAYGFSLVTGQTDLVKKHIILIPIAISKWKELNPIIVGTTYRITEDGLGIYYPEMKNTMLTNVTCSPKNVQHRVIVLLHLQTENTYEKQNRQTLYRSSNNQCFRAS